MQPRRRLLVHLIHGLVHLCPLSCIWAAPALAQSPLYFVRRWTPALLRSLTPQPDENAPRINVSSVISLDVRRLPLPLSRPCCAGHKLTFSLEPRLGGSRGGSTKYSSTAVRALSTDGAGILQQTLVALEHEPLDTLAAALQCEHMVVSITGATTSPAFNQVRTDSRHPAVDPRVCTEFPSSEGRPPPSDTADSKDSRRTSSNGRRPHAPPPGVFRRRRVTQRGTRSVMAPARGVPRACPAAGTVMAAAAAGSIRASSILVTA